VVFSKRDEAVYQGCAPEYFPGPEEEEEGSKEDATKGPEPATSEVEPVDAAREEEK
jgi:hypothetical protein